MHMKFGQSGARGKKNFLKRVNVHDLVWLVLIGVYCPTREFFYSYGDVTITDEGLQILTCSALLAIERGGFFGVPTVTWGIRFYNGHLRGPVTLKPIAERLAVELSRPVFTTGLSWLGFKNPTSACRVNALNHCPTAAV